MPKVKHTILSWARETAQLSLEDAAPKLQISEGKTVSAAEKLAAYEDGTHEPSRAILLRMSKLYRRPLLTFYLDEPPMIGDRGEDFRTLPNQLEPSENVLVDVLIRDIKARQSMVRETLIAEDEGETHEYIGSCSVEQGRAHVTQVLSDVLSLDLDQYRNQASYDDAFKLLRRSAEEAGVFVILKGNLGSHHTNIGVTAFRGFALSDDVAPFIVINDRDAKQAWAFTLLHELAHLALGQTGVSGAIAEKKIEKFCNDVASAFLLPDDDFADFALESLDQLEAAEAISQYAFLKKVSSSHIAYRLYRRGDIDKAFWMGLRDFYHQQWQEQRNKQKARAKDQEGGPNYYIVRKHKLGALVGLVQRLNYSGALSTMKAGMLLEVKPLKVHRMYETPQLA